MDAPPELEDCKPFIVVDKSFEALSLKVPHIHAENCEAGFLLLDDFGDDIYYRVLNNENVDSLYQTAITEIHKIQACQSFNGEAIEHFDAKWQQTELNNFKEWLLGEYLQIELSENDEALLRKTNHCVIQASLSQPQVCIHRDYHSKNLMRLPNGEVGILDFQDAMIGGIFYDLISLVRDCYVDWPIEKVYGWLDYFIEHSPHAFEHSKEQLIYWFDLCGMQRHLKASFIFARKYLRDNDPGYLKYIPRTLNYVAYVSSKYPELNDFHHFLSTKVLTKLEAMSA